LNNPAIRITTRHANEATVNTIGVNMHANLPAFPIVDNVVGVKNGKVVGEGMIDKINVFARGGVFNSR
jgi:hypothetical protein